MMSLKMRILSFEIWHAEQCSQDAGNFDEKDSDVKECITYPRSKEKE